MVSIGRNYLLAVYDDDGFEMKHPRKFQVCTKCGCLVSVTLSDEHMRAIHPDDPLTP